MVRRLFRWAIYLFIILVVLGVAAILLLDTAAKSVAESQIRAQTGLDVKIGKLTVGLASPMVTVEGMTLYNAPEFGGSVFVKMPELHVEYDRDALQRGEIHLKLIRLNLQEIHIVENKDGKSNIQELQKKQKGPGSNSSTNPTEIPLKFTGIDTLNLTIDKARFSSARRPQQNREVTIGIKEQIFKNIKTEKDLEAQIIAVALNKGAAFMIEGLLTSPGSLLQGVTNSSDARKLFDSLIPRKR